MSFLLFFSPKNRWGIPARKIRRSCPDLISRDSFQTAVDSIRGNKSFSKIKRKISLDSIAPNVRLQSKSWGNKSPSKSPIIEFLEKFNPSIATFTAHSRPIMVAEKKPMSLSLYLHSSRRVKMPLLSSNHSPRLGTSPRPDRVSFSWFGQKPESYLLLSHQSRPWSSGRVYLIVYISIIWLSVTESPRKYISIATPPVLKAWRNGYGHLPDPPRDE